jgi:hypothetical protein
VIVRVLVPIGMLGGGFPAATVERGIDRGADITALFSIGARGQWLTRPQAAGDIKPGRSCS